MAGAAALRGAALIGQGRHADAAENTASAPIDPFQFAVDLFIATILYRRKRIAQIAQGQADVLQNGDQFFSGQSPHTFGGTNTKSRIAAAGYPQDTSFTGARTSWALPLTYRLPSVSSFRRRSASGS